MVRRLEAEKRALTPEVPPGRESLYDSNLEHILQGPRAHFKVIRDLLKAYPQPEQLARRFPQLRDAYSLCPRNRALQRFLSELLQQVAPAGCRELEALCRDRIVVLHLTCRPRRNLAEQSIRSFAPLGDAVVHLSLTGNGRRRPPKRLGFRLQDGWLRLPVPDVYERLADKVFYAYTVLALVAKPRLVVKLDDDHRLVDAAVFQRYLELLQQQNVQYSGRLLRARHYQQEQGWHVGKCSEPHLHRMGYQCPFPASYADGGFGYVLGSEALAACQYMYLSMKAFFNRQAVQLEDVFVGLAAESRGIELHDCHPLVPRTDDRLYLYEEAALPGLARRTA